MKSLFLVCVWGVLSLPTFAVAQKPDDGQPAESYGIFQTQGEYFQFMGDVKREGRTNPELMAMVPMLNDVVLGRPFGWTGQKYNGARSTLGLLSDPEVRRDLEMVEDQYKALQTANATIQKRAAEQLRSLDFSDMEHVTQKIMQIRKQSEVDLQATLLPHQMQRLRQILAQSQLREQSLIDMITSDPLKTQLEISDAQKARLLDREQAIEIELEEKIAALREKARQQLLGELNGEQRRKVEGLFGDTFEFMRERESEKRTLKSAQRRSGKPSPQREKKRDPK